MTSLAEPATLPPRTGGWPARLNRLGRYSRIRPSWRLPVLVFLWSQIVLLIWWAGQWPGLLSPDSVRYVIHVTTGPWTADHSVLYDSFVLLSLDLTHNVALLTFVQTTVASAILAFTASSVQAFGVRARWAIIPGIILPCVPSFGAFVSTVWKDVPFAFAEILVAATTIRLLARRRNGATGAGSHWLLISLGFEFLGMVLFRHDGFLMVVVIAVIVAFALKGLRIKVLALGAGALIALFFAQSVIYPAAGIKPASSSLEYGVFYADIAVAYAEAPHIFTAADRRLMEQAAPLKSWRAASNCYISDPLFKKPFNLAAADRVRSRLAALWFKTLARAPVLVTRTHLCRAAVAWSVLPPPASKTTFDEVVTTTQKNLYVSSNEVPPDIARNLTAGPLSTTLGKLTHRLRLAGYEHAWVQIVFFRGASWCYILFLVLFVVVRRLRRWDILAIGAASLANQLSVIAANPAQLYRYMVGPIFIGLLLVPLVMVRRHSAPASTGIEDSAAPEVPATA